MEVVGPHGGCPPCLQIAQQQVLNAATSEQHKNSVLDGTQKPQQTGSADGHGCGDSSLGSKLGAIVWGAHVPSHLSVQVVVRLWAHQLLDPASTNQLVIC